MQYYAEQSNECLMKILRVALGDAHASTCHKCSICEDTAFKCRHEKDFIVGVTSWLNRRTIPIILNSKINNTTMGMALLDEKLRSNDFMKFMQTRNISTDMQSAIPENLLELTQECLLEQARHHRFSCIFPFHRKLTSPHELPHSCQLRVNQSWQAFIINF